MSFTSRLDPGLRRHIRRISVLLLLVGVVVGVVAFGAVTARTAAAAGLNVALLAQGGADFYYPLDATPDPTGSVVYFVAQTQSGEGGVFRVPASGGSVQSVLVGAPLVSPRGIVTSSDGQTLYVADPAARGGGAVLAVTIMDGSVRFVAGAHGLAPRALDLVSECGRDILYVAGTNPANRRADVWRLPADGSGVRVSVLNGSPLALADGVAVAGDGKVYVAGRTGNSDSSDVVLEVGRRGHRPLVRSVTLGSPAGIALTADESTLLVSSLAADGTSQVLIVDLGSNATSTFNDVIGANRGSGGLHRAHDANVYAWAGIGRTGGVYAVRP
ncbi:MAG: hypothetical protein U0822_14630 [Anaerolineae bacterium]